MSTPEAVGWVLPEKLAQQFVELRMSLAHLGRLLDETFRGNRKKFTDVGRTIAIQQS